MGNYVLNQIEIKMNKGKKEKEVLRAILTENNIGLENHSKLRPFDTSEANDESFYYFAKAANMDWATFDTYQANQDHYDEVNDFFPKLKPLLAIYMSYDDSAPKDTPKLALGCHLFETDTHYILYYSRTQKGGIPDTTSDTGYTEDMFDNVKELATKMSDVMDLLNIHCTIAYDSKSEYETYKKRPMKLLDI